MVENWEDNYNQAEDNERLLIQQKYHFPENYLTASDKVKDFNRFKATFNYKDKMFKSK